MFIWEVTCMGAICAFCPAKSLLNVSRLIHVNAGVSQKKRGPPENCEPRSNKPLFDQ